MARKRVQNRCELVIVNATITVDGVKRDLSSIDYERVEYSDGTVEERGRPLSVGPDASVGDVLKAAANALVEKQQRKARKR